MKFLTFVFAVVLSLSFAVNAFAVEMESPQIESGEAPELSFPASDESVNLALGEIMENLDDLNEKVEGIEKDLTEIPENSVSDSGEIEEINPDTDLPVDISLMSVAPITPEDTTGLKSVMLEVIGDYDPIIVEYRYQNSNQTSYSYQREIMPDYPWCASFVMLALVVYCTFRVGGALFNG